MPAGSVDKLMVETSDIVSVQNIYDGQLNSDQVETDRIIAENRRLIENFARQREERQRELLQYTKSRVVRLIKEIHPDDVPRQRNLARRVNERSRHLFNTLPEIQDEHRTARIIRCLEEILRYLRPQAQAVNAQRIRVSERLILYLDAIHPNRLRNAERNWQLYLNWIQENEPQRYDQEVAHYRLNMSQDDPFMRFITSILIFLENIFYPGE